jgi:hypothetical protein
MALALTFGTARPVPGRLARWRIKAIRMLRVAKWCLALGMPAFLGGYATHQIDDLTFSFAQQHECLAQVSSVEGNILPAEGQRLIDDLVINRAQALSRQNGRPWLDNVCAAAYALHYNKSLDRKLPDFSGLDGRTFFDDYSGRYGWDGTKDNAFWALAMASVYERVPFLRHLPFVHHPLDREYVFFFTPPVDEAWFEKKNQAVCDQGYPYQATAKKLHWDEMRFCWSKSAKQES